MKLCISGSRSFLNDDNKINLVHGIVETFVNYLQPTIVHLGGANGVDKIAEVALREMNQSLEEPIQLRIHYPSWDRHGNSAGMIRNQEMINDSDALLAIWDGTSKGTKGAIDMAEKKGIRIYKVII